MHICKSCGHNSAYRRRPTIDGEKHWLCAKCYRKFNNDLEVRLLGLSKEEETKELVDIVKKLYGGYDTQ